VWGFGVGCQVLGTGTKVFAGAEGAPLIHLSTVVGQR